MLPNAPRRLVGAIHLNLQQMPTVKDPFPICIIVVQITEYTYIRICGVFINSKKKFSFLSIKVHHYLMILTVAAFFGTCLEFPLLTVKMDEYKMTHDKVT